MSIPLLFVDAFASAPFQGNPAAVCLLANSPEDSWMRSVAAEMNLSETAFVFPDAGQLRIRWWTPAVEVDLCGHATIAATFAIRELAASGSLPEAIVPFWKDNTVQFISRSGPLMAEHSSHGITLDFPATRVESCSPPDGLVDSLRLNTAEVLFCGRSRFDYLVQLPDAARVRQLQPDLTRLASLPVRGIIVTAVGDESSHDFVSRFFAPAAGVPEDPVTGSAHCALAPFWAPQFGRDTLFGYQASKRGGLVRMELRGERVRLSGKAVLVSRGELFV